MSDSEATLTVKIQATEEVQPGPPRPPAPAAPEAPPISKAPVQPPAPAPVQPPTPIPPQRPATAPSPALQAEQKPQTQAVPQPASPTKPPAPPVQPPAQVVPPEVVLVQAPPPMAVQPPVQLTEAPKPTAVAQVQPPQKPTDSSPPTEAELNRKVPSLGVALGSLPPQVQAQIVAVWRAEQASKQVTPQPQAPVQGPALPGDALLRQEAALAHQRDEHAKELARIRQEMFGTPGIGTRGERLLREDEKAKRAQEGKAPEPPHDAGWFLERAREQAQKEAERKAIEEARLQVDPAFAAKKQEDAAALDRKQESQAEREERRREKEAERQEQRRQREAERNRPHDQGWAMERAREAEQRRREQQQIEQARRILDPVFAKKKDEDEAAAGQRQRIQTASLGAMALGAAGMPGLAKIPAGYAIGAQAGQAVSQVSQNLGFGAMAAAGPVGGIVGAVTGAVKLVMDKIEEAMKAAFKIGGAMISFDPDRFARGMADLVGKVPLVGGLMGGLAHGILDLSDAIGHTAERLAQYNGALATQIAQFEVIRIQRDINRANQFGPQIMAANEARFRFQQKLEDLIDRFTPMFLKIAETLLDMVSALADLPGTLQGFMTGHVATLLEGMQAIAQTIGLNPAWLSEAIRQLRTVANNTAPPLGGGITPMEEFFSMQQGLQNLIEQAPQPGIGFNPAALNFAG